MLRAKLNTHPIHSIDGFIAYAARYSSGFLDRIKGASEQETARLGEMSGYSLPDTYCQFLQRMGRKPADMTFEDCHISLRAVTGFYEAMRINPRLTLPDACPVIGAYGVASGEFCLDMDSGPDPHIVIVTDEDEIEFYATSLLTLLYHTAFYDYRLTATPRQDYIRSYDDVGRRDRRPEARRLAERLDFRGQWFDEEVNFHGERGSAGLYFSQPPQHSLSLRVAPGTLAEAQAIGSEFARALGLQASNRR